MRVGLIAFSVVVSTFFVAGCLSSPATPQAAKDSGGLAKYVAQLPPVYVSSGQLRDPAYDAPDFPRVVEVMVGAHGGEPNIGVTSKGGIFVTAFDSTMRSTDGGRTWQHVYELEAVKGAPVDPMSTSDPMLWVDPLTDRVFTFHMWPILACNVDAVSDDNGDSWTQIPGSCGIPVEDHQKVMTAKPHAGGPQPSPLYKDIVYYCYNKLVSTDCAASLDGGIHFEYETIALGSACGGINGSPASGPDGTIIVPAGNNCGRPYVAVSQDNGLTWTERTFGDSVKVTDPQTQVWDIDPEVTVTPDGTAYYYSRGGDGSGYLFRTKDYFAHVDGPFKVSPPDVKGVVFGGMASGSDGRLAIAYLGNREWAADPSKAPDNTRWHLFVTNTYDAEAAKPTFTTHQVTPNDDPVQIGCIWLQGGGNPCRNLLDFIDAVADKDGRLHVAFTDGCTEAKGCAKNPKATPDESRDRAIAIAIQDHGPSLFADKGLLPSLNWAKQVNDPTGANGPPK